MSFGKTPYQSFWHSPLGVSSLAAFVVALKVGLWKSIAVGAAWIVGFIAGTSILRSGASYTPAPGSAQRYCEDSVREESCINLITSYREHLQLVDNDLSNG